MKVNQKDSEANNASNPNVNNDNNSSNNTQSSSSGSSLGGMNVSIASRGNTVPAAIDLLVILLITLIIYLLTLNLILAFIVFIFVLIVVLALSLRIVNQWDRLAVLHLGKYAGLIGPGLYFIIPIIESTPIKIDLRVRSMPFSAEKTLTKDNVPVDVEAILFWQVIDPEKAILNVQNYVDSISLAAQTALRDVIGQNDLATLLSERNSVGASIKTFLSEKVVNWGIAILGVEIRDVTIPMDLQTAMAKVATAEREKNARVLLAESESLAADKMLEAAEKYRNNMFAMQLRALNMMYEISTTGRNLIIFIPTESKGFSLPTPLGILGLNNLTGSTSSDNQSSSNTESSNESGGYSRSRKK
ncbi:MAG: stomatin [Candidatus Micrarchaeota archaeon]|nr:MAG: stomatin [Candidatus Micrarchaeota archaeon]